LGSFPYGASYSYDPAGNRTFSGLPTATDSQYDAANQLKTSVTASGTTTYQHDLAGNLQVTIAPGGARTTNIWDGENQLVGVQLASAQVNTNVFNGDGQRVQLQNSTGTSNIVWDGRAYLLETGANNVTTVVYTQEPTQFGNLISQWRNT
jgi:YD repeat-containing protein